MDNIISGLLVGLAVTFIRLAWRATRALEKIADAFEAMQQHVKLQRDLEDQPKP
ncbi:hypothetical protein BH11VER1_BH11VER1_41120 [soil metagenome]